MDTTKAVVLARGLGSRMRRHDPAASGTDVSDAQSSVADTGVKGMIPIGRPFLDYVLSALADAGITDVCLVIGPEHDAIRDYYSRAVSLQRLRVHFAIQPTPLGTADAMLAAEPFADGEHVLALNSDNYYPVHTLAGLRELGMAGVAAFERDALVKLSNIDPERVAKYSVVEIAEDGTLDRIIEKPDAAELTAFGGATYVGMNSWSLPPEIYHACRSIQPSPRGELELPLAVQYAVDVMRIRFSVLKYSDGVLDLSNRSDIPAVAARLQDVEPRL